MKEQRYDRRGGWTGGRMTVMDLFLRAKEQKTSTEKVFEEVYTDTFVKNEEEEEK